MQRHKYLKGGIFFASLAVLLGSLAAGLAFKTLQLDKTSAATNTSVNLAVSTATYLGGATPSNASAVDVAPDGSVVLAGTLPTYNRAGITSINLLNGNAGTIVRLDRSGQTIHSITHIGNQVNDLRISKSGAMVACGDFGVAVLDSTASKVVWNNNVGQVARCAIGNDDTVAAIVGKAGDDSLVGGATTYVFNAKGSLLSKIAPYGSYQNDVTVDSAHGMVITTGFTQYGSPIQVAYIKGWSYAGKEVWKSYDFTLDGIRAHGLMADTRGYRVNMGRDGFLYFTGESAGGNTIFHTDPKNVNLNPDQNHSVAYDMYTNPYNTSSNHITWYGRYDPQNGALIKGQFLLARNTAKGNKGNTIRARGIAADEKGQVYIVGLSSYAIANRDAQKIGGIAVGGYQGNDSFLFVSSSDLSKRLVWTTFSGSGKSSSLSIAGVSARGGTAALAMTANQGSLITYKALQNTVMNSTSTPYLAVWPSN